MSPLAAFIERTRNESLLAVLVPSSDRLFHRYERFRRFEAFLFLYNTAIIYLVLGLNLKLIEWATPPSLQFTSPGWYKVIMYLEGLVRYCLWAGANYPFIQHFRRSFDASIYLTGTLPGLRMGLYFARPFFLASIAGSLVYNMTRSPQFMTVAADWFLGAQQQGGSRAVRELLQLLHLFFHEVALAIFRAMAVAYALFGGRSASKAILRAFVGYALWAIFLFTFHHWGENMFARHLMMNRNAQGPFGYPGPHQAISDAALRLAWLIPYYVACWGGALVFLRALRQSGRPGALSDEEFETH